MLALIFALMFQSVQTLEILPIDQRFATFFVPRPRPVATGGHCP